MTPTTTGGRCWGCTGNQVPWSAQLCELWTLWGRLQEQGGRLMAGGRFLTLPLVFMVLTACLKAAPMRPGHRPRELWQAMAAFASGLRICGCCNSPGPQGGGNVDVESHERAEDTG